MSNESVAGFYWSTRKRILYAPRADQNKYLRNNGFEPLVARADVWFNPHFPGTLAHNVYTRRAAIEEVVWLKAVAKFGRSKPPAVHHHEGAPL